MTAGVPARLSSTELMPPEVYLRPGHGHRLTLFFLTFVVWMTMIMWLLFGAGAFSGGWLLLMIGSSIVIGRRATKASEMNQRAVNLLNAGEVNAAGEVFDELARKRRYHHGHVVFVYNCAVAALLQGRHQRALSIFNAIDKSGQMRRRAMRNLEPNLYIEMGCCLALTGDIEEARGYLRRAATFLQPPEDARLLFLEAVIAVRSGDLHAAASRIDQQWRRAEGSLRGPTIRTLRLVHAFALSQLGQGDSEQFKTLVAGAQPARRDDFIWSTAHWPEFDEFVRRFIPE